MFSVDPMSDLVASLGHQFPATRLRAAKELGKLGPRARDSLPALSEAVHDSDPKVREAVAQAIGQIGPHAVNYLANLLKHPDKYVRRQSVWALGRMSQVALKVLPDICEALRDDDPRTASGAAQAIGAMGPQAAEAIPPLIEAMRGTNIVLCRLAAKALSQIGRPALSTLIQHLHHHDSFVRGEAAVALGWIGPAAAPAVGALLDLLRISRPSSKATPSNAIGMINTPATSLLAKNSTTPATEDVTRAAICQALGRIGPDARSAVNELSRCLDEPCDIVRKAAETAIRQIQGTL